jgi:ATP-binding cassette subfamily B protein/subfamily B ATP-binding cassette protein MsbA
MIQFLKVIRLSFRYKWTIILSAINALLIAAFWGASISAVYPFVEVVFKGKTAHTWLEERIAQAEIASAHLEKEIDDLRSEQRNAPQEQQPGIAGQIAIAETHLLAHRKAREYYTGLKPTVDRWAPMTPFGTLVAVITALVIVTAIKGVCLVLSTVLVIRVAAFTVADMRRIFFRRVLVMDQQKIDQIGTSSLMTIFSHNIQLVEGGLIALYGKSIREPLKIVACLAVACFISWRLLLLSLIFAPLGGLLIHFLATRMKRATEKEIRGYSTIFQTLMETLGNMRIVRIFTQQRTERQRFKKDCQTLRDMAVRVSLFDSVIRPITELTGILTISVAILCGGYLVLNQQTHLFGLRMSSQPLGVGEMFTFFAMLAGVSDPARKLSDIYNMLVRAVMAARGMFLMFEEQPKIAAPVQPVPTPQHSSSIRFEDVHFEYVPGVPVLHGIDLEIPFGQTVAVIGRNGSGKSTLANLIARFYDPSVGNIYLDDVNLRDIRPRQLHKQIALVEQDPALFRETLWMNIQYGNSSATRQQIRRSARLAQVMPFLQELPRKFESDVGDRGSFLSGGQRQRVTLARAIASDPRIAILDEPVSQIDMYTLPVLQQGLREFLAGKTAILITHQPSLLALADRVIAMSDGRIIEDRVLSPNEKDLESLSMIVSKIAA